LQILQNSYRNTAVSSIHLETAQQFLKGWIELFLMMPTN